MKDCNLGSSKEIDELISLNVEVLKLLSATLSTLRRKRMQGSKAFKEESTEYVVNLP